MYENYLTFVSHCAANQLVPPATNNTTAQPGPTNTAQPGPSTTAQPGPSTALVLCPYAWSLDHNATELCTLWCQIQELNASRRRCATCPAVYAADPEAERLCQLWLVLTNLEDSGAGQLITFGPVEAVVCPHAANPTSAPALCDLWCRIQA